MKTLDIETLAAVREQDDVRRQVAARIRQAVARLSPHPRSQAFVYGMADLINFFPETG